MATSSPDDGKYMHEKADIDAMRAMIKLKNSTDSRPGKVTGSKRKHDEMTQDPEDPTETLLVLNRKKAQDKQRQRIQNKTVEFLRLRSENRLSGVQPSNERRPRKIVEERILQHITSKNYRMALQALSEEMLTAGQIEKLDAAKGHGPNYLGRTASLEPGYRFNMWKRATNGFTTKMILMPAADTHKDQALHADLSTFTQGELVYILGHHLIWTDAPSDEFLSYSKDPLFLVVHALNRYHQGQGGVTIQFLDRRRAKDVKGEQAAFFSALDLYQTFEVVKWRGWSIPQRISLSPRKFTQEFLTHGCITVEDSRFVQAPIEALIRDGLFEIFPSFHVPREHRRCGLYTGQVVLRKVGYPPNAAAASDGEIYSYDRCAQSVPFTIDFLQRVRKLTKNFMSPGDAGEPHLHIFLSFLTFQKRPREDAVFVDWIKEHYKGKLADLKVVSPANESLAGDVTGLYDDGHGGIQAGFTRVASNLPGVMQYLDLVRDAATAFSLPELPPNDIETSIDMVQENYTEADAKNHRNSTSWYPFDEKEQNQLREARRACYRKKTSPKKKGRSNSTEVDLEVDVQQEEDVNSENEEKIEAGDEEGGVGVEDESEVEASDMQEAIANSLVDDEEQDFELETSDVQEAIANSLAE